MTALQSGFLLTFITGLLWSFVGIYYKAMAKWKLNVYGIMLLSGALSFLLTLLFFTKAGSLFSGAIPAPSPGYVLFLFAASLANVTGSFILQRSMVYGRSGVTWAIGQSAFILPFLFITLFFSEPWSTLKGAGTLSVLAGILLFAAKTSSSDRNDAPQPKYGIRLALLAFLVLGAAQSMTSMSSFFSYRDQGLIRPAIACFSTFLAAVAGKFLMKEKGFSLDRRALLIILLHAAQTVVATSLQFLALDKLKVCGMNGIFFPVAIGCCIALYSVWSVLFFKEKANKSFLFGILLILGGIFCYFLADAAIVPR
ncbi:MAG: hypothetical protein J6A21_04030 [Lentisphaeria bacterium]|nr:hypothetical protein [Lentisphaeria bacterium]